MATDPQNASSSSISATSSSSGSGLDANAHVPLTLGQASTSTSHNATATTTTPTSTATSALWRFASWASPAKRTKLPSKITLPSSVIVKPAEATSVGVIFNERDGANTPLPREDGKLSDGTAPPPSARLAVDDEGVSMLDASGKVDFLSSLPLEISLYLLLFIDYQDLCNAMRVSKLWHDLAGDPVVWREHFYGNPGWHVSPAYLESAHNLVSNSLSPLTSPHSRENGLSSRYQTPTRQRCSTTVTSDGSIAQRIGRRIGDLMSEMSYLAIGQPKSPTTPTQHASQQSAAESLAALLNTDSVRDGAPHSRSRSATSTSHASAGPAAFLANVTPTRPALGIHRLSTNQSASGAAQRRLSTSLDAAAAVAPMSLLSGLGVSNEGTPSLTAVARYRSVSGGNPTAFSPYQSYQRPASPSALRSAADDSMLMVTAQETRNALRLDWRGLYRDRRILEQRWNDGSFVTRSFKGHLDSVYCVIIRGNVLLSGSRDKTIKLWDLTTGELLKTIEKHTASVLAIQIDATTMATGSSNGELFVWDVDDWEVTTRLSGHSAGVLDVQMNETYIASCSKDTSIRVWRRDTLEPYRILSGHRGPVNAIQLWQNTIVSASGDATAKLWDIETGQTLRVFKGHERGLACTQFNGDVLMTGSNDKTIRIWDPSTGECLKVLKGHKDLVRTLAYDPLRRRIFSGSYDRSTRLWDLDTGNLKMTFKTSHTSLVFDVGLDVSRIISCSHDKRIVLIDFGEGLEASRFM